MKLLSIKHFCEIYHVSRSTVYRLKAQGVLPFVYIGRAVRIRVEDAEAWANSLRGEVSNDNE
ncbi:MAG TPA: helix-turn-helix domain-containing protein [Novosphingobium sp.]|nr:helix-turn-helix domain-containing protein [Novosphingobium sp.]